MFDIALGFSMDDLRKLKKMMDIHYVKDIDEFLLCFDEAKLKEFRKNGLLKERDKIDKLLKEEE